MLLEVPLPRDAPWRDVPLFSSLDESTLQRLTHDAKVECCEDGDVIFRQGDKVTSVVIVLQGYVKLLRVASCGDETLINICSNGESVNEALNLRGESYSVSAEAIGRARILKLSATRFAHLLRESPALALAVINETTNKISSLIGEIESLKAQSADKRLARFILSLCPRGEERCKFRLPYDKRLIAARLGIKQETLSRAFAKLREVGVRTETRNVYVESVARLVAALSDLARHPHPPVESRPQANDNLDAAPQ
jgi:CRP-like cAMP-binding protein